MLRRRSKSYPNRANGPTMGAISLDNKSFRSLSGGFLLGLSPGKKIEFTTVLKPIQVPTSKVSYGATKRIEGVPIKVVR